MTRCRRLSSAIIFIILLRSLIKLTLASLRSSATFFLPWSRLACPRENKRYKLLRSVTIFFSPYWYFFSGYGVSARALTRQQLPLAPYFWTIRKRKAHMHGLGALMPGSHPHGDNSGRLKYYFVGSTAKRQHVGADKLLCSG